MENPPVSDPPVGFVLREARHRLGITIEVTARRADMHPIYYGDVERGKRNPTIKILHRILPVLELTWTDFGRALDEAAYYLGIRGSSGST